MRSSSGLQCTSVSGNGQATRTAFPLTLLMSRLLSIVKEGRCSFQFFIWSLMVTKGRVACVSPFACGNVETSQGIRFCEARGPENDKTKSDCNCTSAIAGLQFEVFKLNLRIICLHHRASASKKQRVCTWRLGNADENSKQRYACLCLHPRTSKSQNNLFLNHVLYLRARKCFSKRHEGTSRNVGIGSEAFKVPRFSWES